MVAVRPSLKRAALLWALCGVLYWTYAVAPSPNSNVIEKAYALPIMTVLWPLVLYNLEFRDRHPNSFPLR